jgi:signal transduction histidine kinase
VIWLSRLGWAVLAAVTLVTAVGIFLVQPTDPDHALVIDRAVYQPGNGSRSEIALPHVILPSLSRGFDVAHYDVHFDLGEVPAEALFLYVPVLNRRISVALNGEPIFNSDARTLWAGPVIGSSVLLHLPRPMLVAGRNDVAVDFEVGQFALPTYLSRMYVGAEAALAPNFKLRVFLEDRLKTMALAAHVLLGLGIICAYFYRPKDSLFGWLAAMVVVSFVLSVGMFAGFQPELQEILPYIGALSPLVGLLAIGVTFALIGQPPPKLLQVLCFAVPCIGWLLILAGAESSKVLVTLVDIPVLIAAFVVATGVVAYGAICLKNVDARLMLPPFFLVCVFLIRDFGIAAGFFDEPFVLYTPYVRPLILGFVMIVLMRRLATSLDDLDSANENLNRRLAAREGELAALHREERLEAARQVREEERERLTRDLHDGISGHLVSIIAMAERGDGDVKPIEHAAREALDDLRLVIYSLELGDSELPLALANFRERLIPRLRRSGVELDWSTADLPEVTGVTPANALIVLRILQEAITNALKHGPARRIMVRGAPADGMVAITVGNDGRAFVEGGSGHGLENMRRRAAQLQGRLCISPLDGGTEVTLLLPRCLPDVAAN